MPNVTVTPPSVIKVQVGTTTTPSISTINYGGVSRLRDLTDVQADNLQDGYSLVYSSAIDKFILAPSTTTNIDNGFF